MVVLNFTMTQNDLEGLQNTDFWAQSKFSD